MIVFQQLPLEKLELIDCIRLQRCLTDGH